MLEERGAQNNTIALCDRRNGKNDRVRANKTHWWILAVRVPVG